jgi:hypothetical protein
MKVVIRNVRGVMVGDFGIFRHFKVQKSPLELAVHSKFDIIFMLWFIFKF